MYPVQWARVIPSVGLELGIQNAWAGFGSLELTHWVSCLPAGGPSAPGLRWKDTATPWCVCVWPLAVKCPLLGSLMPLAVTWMTGYSGQEKIALTSCDSGKVNHIGTWPLNTQGAGSNLRGWLGAPLSSLVISWLLSWTGCPSFSDKLCLKEWWADCH